MDQSTTREPSGSSSRGGSKSNESIGNALDSGRDAIANTATVVAGQVSDAAAGLKESGTQLATAATEQAKTFASELESMARRNPLGAMAGAVLVGVLIGLMGRSRS